MFRNPAMFQGLPSADSRWSVSLLKDFVRFQLSLWYASQLERSLRSPILYFSFICLSLGADAFYRSLNQRASSVPDE